MKTVSELSRIALGDLNHYWTLEDEREFIRVQDEKTAQELADHFDRDIYEVIVLSLHIKRQHERLEEMERGEALSFDEASRMNYHPLYHDRQGQTWTVEELQYLCTWHDVDGLNKVGLALGRTAKTLSSQLGNIRKNGLYEIYRQERERNYAKH
jgi:hypothetical protein